MALFKMLCKGACRFRSAAARRNTKKVVQPTVEEQMEEALEQDLKDIDSTLSMFKEFGATTSGTILSFNAQ